MELLQCRCWNSWSLPQQKLEHSSLEDSFSAEGNRVQRSLPVNSPGATFRFTGHVCANCGGQLVCRKQDHLENQCAHFGNIALKHAKSDAMTSQHSQGSELQAKGKTGTGQWLSRLKGWMTASEPSAEALKKHKKIIYKNSGISLKDPQANTKLWYVPNFARPAFLLVTNLPILKPSGCYYTRRCDQASLRAGSGRFGAEESSGTAVEPQIRLDTSAIADGLA